MQFYAFTCFDRCHQKTPRKFGPNHKLRIMTTKPPSATKSLNQRKMTWHQRMNMAMRGTLEDFMAMICMGKDMIMMMTMVMMDMTNETISPFSPSQYLLLPSWDGAEKKWESGQAKIRSKLSYSPIMMPQVIAAWAHSFPAIFSLWM